MGNRIVFPFLPSVCMSMRRCVSDLLDAFRLLPREPRCAHPTQTGSQNNDSATCAEFTSNYPPTLAGVHRELIKPMSRQNDETATGGGRRRYGLK